MTEIVLSNGKPFDFTAAAMVHVTPDVVARSLAQQCRYAGHTPGFYSVAEHSWYVMQEVGPADAWAALMHDAHECVVQDIVRPLKTDAFRAFEAMASKLFEDHFEYEITPAVIEADDRLLAREMASFFGTGGAKPFRGTVCLAPGNAKAVWLDAFDMFCPARFRGMT